eukprot:Sspe_Gene.53848::Locus_29736_Transcript_1_1_Confidence_1.000_Length_1089::g.53848::m.53848/K06950/K06950; uncharacterized protein
MGEWTERLDAAVEGLPAGQRATLKGIAVNLAGLLEEKGIPATSSHGVMHSIMVLEHAVKAVLAEQPRLEPSSEWAVLLAALLHDADDVKVFGEGSNNLPALLASAEEEGMEEVVSELVDLVSCRKNRNDTGVERWKLIPRDADRLEAIGEVGLVRCYKYNTETNRPIVVADTPLASTPADLNKIATPERFVRYSGGSSSMLDHCYDKLLHICTVSSGNHYLTEAAAARRGAVEKFCLMCASNVQDAVSWVEELTEKLV